MTRTNRKPEDLQQGEWTIATDEDTGEVELYECFARKGPKVVATVEGGWVETDGKVSLKQMEKLLSTARKVRP